MGCRLNGIAIALFSASLLVCGCMGIGRASRVRVTDPPYLSPEARPLQSPSGGSLPADSNGRQPQTNQTFRPESTPSPADFPRPGQDRMSPRQDGSGKDAGRSGQLNSPSAGDPERLPGLDDTPGGSSPRIDDPVPTDPIPIEELPPIGIEPTESGQRPRPRPAPSRTPDSEADPGTTGRPSTAGPTLLRPQTGSGTQSWKIELDVSGPMRRLINDEFVCALLIRNDSQTDSPELSIECDLDDGVALPGRADRFVQQSIGIVKAGEQRTVRLTVVGTRPGSECLQFRVRSGSLLVTEERFCLEVVRKELSLDILAPAQRIVGGSAEYQLIVHNPTQRVMEQVRLEVEHSELLQVRGATAGATRSGNRLAWSLGSLGPEETVQLQVEFHCGRISERCSLLARVTAGGSLQCEEEAVLEVRAIPGNLEMQIRDQEDPVAVGTSAQVQIDVINRGLQPARTVTLELRLPAGIRLESAEVQLNGRAYRLPYRVQGERLEFTSVPTLDSESRLTFRIKLATLLPGNIELVASLSDELREVPIQLTEWISITPAHAARSTGNPTR